MGYLLAEGIGDLLDGHGHELPVFVDGLLQLHGQQPCQMRVAVLHRLIDVRVEVWEVFECLDVAEFFTA